MNQIETKKDLNPEIKKELEKSKLEVLTNENDFLVKNLKKAGWSTRAFKNFSNNKLFKISFQRQNCIFLDDNPKILSLSNIKFLLNLQINTPDTKHINQILVILIGSQYEIRLDICGNSKVFKIF